jgi:hypothetical protein
MDEELEPRLDFSLYINRRRLCINKAILFAHGLPIADERSNSVYLRCTSLGVFVVFLRFVVS